MRRHYNHESTCITHLPHVGNMVLIRRLRVLALSCHMLACGFSLAVIIPRLAMVPPLDYDRKPDEIGSSVRAGVQPFWPRSSAERLRRSRAAAGEQADRPRPAQVLGPGRVRADPNAEHPDGL